MADLSFYVIEGLGIGDAKSIFCQDSLTVNKYIGTGGGKTNVRPVAAAIINMFSRFILILFHPPLSGSNVMYFGLAYTQLA